jgi:hypothetical protein
MELKRVMVNMPLKNGNHAVTAVARPRTQSIKSARVCSRKKSKILITPTARKPGISLIVCRRPISRPSNLMISTTKLFRRADQTENAKGKAIAMSIKRASGRLHFDNVDTLVIENSSFMACL